MLWIFPICHYLIEEFNFSKAKFNLEWLNIYTCIHPCLQSRFFDYVFITNSDATWFEQFFSGHIFSLTLFRLSAIIATHFFRTTNKVITLLISFKQMPIYHNHLKLVYGNDGIVSLTLGHAWEHLRSNCVNCFNHNLVSPEVDLTHKGKGKYSWVLYFALILMKLTFNLTSRGIHRDMFLKRPKNLSLSSLLSTFGGNTCI